MCVNCSCRPDLYARPYSLLPNETGALFGPETTGGLIGQEDSFFFISIFFSKRLLFVDVLAYWHTSYIFAFSVMFSIPTKLIDIIIKENRQV